MLGGLVKEAANQIAVFCRTGLSLPLRQTTVPSMGALVSSPMFSKVPPSVFPGSQTLPLLPEEAERWGTVLLAHRLDRGSPRRGTS